jgi:hypothetical protein
LHSHRRSPHGVRFWADRAFSFPDAAIALLAGQEARSGAGSSRGLSGRAESGLLEKPVLALASQFQGHHKEHADVLKNQADVLRFAASPAGVKKPGPL